MDYYSKEKEKINNNKKKDNTVNHNILNKAEIYNNISNSEKKSFVKNFKNSNYNYMNENINNNKLQNEEDLNISFDNKKKYN